MNRRLPDLKPSTAAARRRTRIDGDKQVSTLHDFQERRNREFRRTHEDNSHRAATSQIQISEALSCPKFCLAGKNFVSRLGRGHIESAVRVGRMRKTAKYFCGCPIGVTTKHAGRKLGRSERRAN